MVYGMKYFIIDTGILPEMTAKYPAPEIIGNRMKKMGCYRTKPIYNNRT